MATTIETLASQKARRRGPKRMVSEEVFALTLQQVWQRASKSATLGAGYNEHKGGVAGDALKLATELLSAADLSDRLPKVREALQKPIRTRGLDPEANARIQREIRCQVDQFFKPAEVSFLVIPEDDESA